MPYPLGHRTSWQAVPAFIPTHSYKKAVLGIEPRTSHSLSRNCATRPISQLMWGSRRPLVSPRAKNTCAGHLWKVGLENDLALAILAMKTFALTADYLLPGKFFGGHLGEGRSNVLSSKSTFQWAKLCFKGAFDFPLPGLPLPGKSLRAISPRCFQAAFFWHIWLCCSEKFSTAHPPSCFHWGRHSGEGLSTARGRTFFDYTVGCGIFLQSQSERIIWSW